MRTVFVATPLVLLALLSACPAEEEATPTARTGPEAGGAGAGGETPEGDAVNDDLQARGAAIAKETIEVYGQAVDDCAAALEEKPGEDVAIERLTAIFEEYRPKMEALAARKEALEDVEERYGFSSYIDEHRGPAVHRKDEVLGPYVVHYRLMAPGPKVVEFIAKRITGLIDIVHSR